jgi:integrase
MSSIRSRSENSHLFSDFRYLGRRCREQTQLPDTPANRKKLQKVLDKIEAEMTLGTFDYASYFPSSPRVQQFEHQQSRIHTRLSNAPTFKVFAEL